MAKSKYNAQFKIIRDPIHSYIHLDDVETKIIDSDYFQRLRYIKQSSTAYLTYPSALGTRFEHSIGVTHIAGKMINSVLSKLDRGKYRSTFLNCAKDAGFGKRLSWHKTVSDDEILQRIVRVVRLGALCHDIGHLPFSHALEFAFERNGKIFDLVYAKDEITRSDLQTRKLRLHEYAGMMITKTAIKKMFKDDDESSLLCDLTIQMFDSEKREKKKILETLYGILNSDLDADRCDFVARDGTMSGIGFGVYDLDRIVDSLRLHFDATTDSFIILPCLSGVSAAEAALLERYKIYKWLNYHHKVVFTDVLLSTLASQIMRTLAENKLPNLSKIFEIEKFHYKNYTSEGIYFDDIHLMNSFRMLYRYLKSNNFQKDDHMNSIIIMLEVLLQRSNRGESAWKTTLEYWEEQEHIFEILGKALTEKENITRNVADQKLRKKPLLNGFAEFIHDLQRSKSVSARERLESALMEMDKEALVIFDTKIYRADKLQMLSKDLKRKYPIEQWSPLLSKMPDVLDHDIKFYLYFISKNGRELDNSRKKSLLKSFSGVLSEWYLNDKDIKSVQGQSIYQRL